MGITTFDMMILLQHPQPVAPGAKALVYGKLGVSDVTPALAETFFRQHDREFVNYDAVDDDQLVSDASLLRNFGFAVVHPVHAEGSGGALEFDLAETHAEHALYGQYDAVFDLGAIEHVFDVRAFFENTVRFLKPGGRAYHSTRAGGSLDHRFFQPSPALFWDYYAANGLRLEYVLSLHRDKQFSLDGRIQAHDPTLFRDLGGGDEHAKSVVTVFACAERLPGSTWNRKPTRRQVRLRDDAAPRLPSAESA